MNPEKPPKPWLLMVITEGFRVSEGLGCSTFGDLKRTTSVLLVQRILQRLTDVKLKDFPELVRYLKLKLATFLLSSVISTLILVGNVYWPCNRVGFQERFSRRGQP